MPAAASSRRSQKLRARLKVKADLKSKQPAPLTAKELSRQAAYQRLPDLIPTLSLPGASKSRSSYSLPVLVQAIQSSAHNPISKKEVEACLLVLSELAPAFLSMVKFGEAVGVVIDHQRRPRDLNERISKMNTRSQSVRPPRVLQATCAGLEA